MRLFSKIFGKPHRRIVVGSRTGKSKKFPLHLPKRTFFTVVVVNSGQNTPPQSLYWWSKPVYPQTRAAEESGSFLEQDSTTVPKFAYRSFCPGGNLVGECLPQTLLMRLAPFENLRKFFSDFFKNSSALPPVFLLFMRGQAQQFLLSRLQIFKKFSNGKIERRSTDYETIQHAPPQPCSQDPHDR